MSKITKSDIQYLLWEVEAVTKGLERIALFFDNVDEVTVSTALYYCTHVYKYLKKYHKEVKNEKK